MVQPTPLYHVNGGQPAIITCANCGAQLHDGNDRACANTPGGPRFFCKADPEHPQDSCYLQWKARRH